MNIQDFQIICNINKNNNALYLYLLFIMSKSLVVLAVSSLFAATLSFVKLNDHLKQFRSQTQEQSDQPMKKKKRNGSQLRHHQTSTLYSDQGENNQTTAESRDLYENEIRQESPSRLLIKKPIQNLDISHLRYNILLNLNKSKDYEGVIKIKFFKSKSILSDDLFIDFQGGLILFMSVNERRIREQDVSFKNHQILIKDQWLSTGNQNQIQIGFSTKYSFMADGLSCYFPLDERNKYSLKGQVIYTRNGFYKVTKIFPCFNILNSCQVSLDVLHPTGFNAESNSHKNLVKIATQRDYPMYNFLFQSSSQFSLKNSYRKNRETISSSQSLKKTQKQMIKTESKFEIFKLNSIHQFFLFCSSVVEIRSSMNLTKSRSSVNLLKNYMKDLLIRYFSKQNMAKKASLFVSLLQSQLVQIFQKVQQYRKIHHKMPKYHGKIDIFFVDDGSAEGDFYPGVILLSQKSIEKGVIDRRLYFLLCRAVVGLAIMSKRKQNVQKFESIIKLNELTLQIFNECCDFLYVKNKEYQNIRNEYIKLIKQKYTLASIPNPQQNQQREEKEIEDRLHWILEYYEQQCRYFIANTENHKKNISINVRNILENLYDMDREEYWPFFNARHSFIEFNVAEILIKISLKYKGKPTNAEVSKYCKQNFMRSQSYLYFYSLKQIQNLLKTLIELKCEGIQKVLPLIKINQSMLNWIPKPLLSYLSIVENKKECLKLYEQFKNYNEQKNFHHISALKREVKRIQMLISQQISQCHQDIQCSLHGWKLLSKLKIYPQDMESYFLIKWLQKVKTSSCNEKVEKQLEKDRYEQVNSLEKLIQEVVLE